MDISGIHITLMDDSTTKGTAAVTFDDCFVVRHLRVELGTDGYYVAMPQHKLIDGTYADIASPTNAATHKVIESAVLKAFYSQINEVQANPLDGLRLAGQMSMGGD